MNLWWLAAGLLCLVTAFVHTVAGHFNPVLPFLRAELDATVKATLYACWHLVTVTLFLSALALVGLGLSPGLAGASLLAVFLAGLYILYGLVLPQWVLLWPVGILAALGACAAGRQPSRPPPRAGERALPGACEA